MGFSLAASGLLVYGCSSSNNNNGGAATVAPSRAPAADGSPAPGGAVAPAVSVVPAASRTATPIQTGGTLRFWENADSANLDPVATTTTIQRLVAPAYNNLIQFDPLSQ